MPIELAIISDWFCLCFRTVWYEMCAGAWPWKRQHPETIIYQVGKGCKQSLNNLDIPTEVKVIGDKTYDE